MSDDIKFAVLPRHAGLITDGNRRWAKEHNLPSFEGHRRGLEAAKGVIRRAFDLGIEEFTAWAFSTENWNRSREEIDYLMDLFEKWLLEFSDQCADKNIKIRTVGQKWRVPASLQQAIERAEKQTQNHTGQIFNLALSYGGRDEIVQGIKKIMRSGVDAEEISEKTISDNLWLPDADMIIRTGGELRLSGFLTWESVYAELFFVKKYLPDFTPEDFEEILADYSKRKRRFGK